MLLFTREDAFRNISNMTRVHSGGVQGFSGSPLRRPHDAISSGMECRRCFKDAWVAKGEVEEVGGSTFVSGSGHLMGEGGW